MKKRILVLAATLFFAVAGSVILDVALLASDERVHALAVEGIESQLNVRVELEAATYHIFGNVELSGLTLHSLDDPEDASSFAYPKHHVLRVESASIRPNLLSLLGVGSLVRAVILDNVELHVSKNRDGAVNLARLIKPSIEPSEAIELPRIVIKGFRVWYADLSENPENVVPTAYPPINLSLRPHKLQWVDDAINELSVGLEDPYLGKVLVKTRFNGNFSHVEMESASDQNILLLDSTLHKLLPIGPRRLWSEFQVKGSLHIDELLLTLDSQGPRPVKLNAKFRAEKCSINSARFPLPVHHLEGSLQVSHGRLIFDVAGRSGPATILGRGELSGLLAGDLLVDATASIDGATPAMIRKALTRPRLEAIGDAKTAAARAALAESMTEILDRYDPKGGSITAKVAINNREAEPDVIHSNLTMHLKDVSGSYENFPYRVYHMDGEIAVQDDAITITRLAGATQEDLAAAGRVSIHGRVTGSGADENVNVDIILSEIPLDEKVGGGFLMEQSRKMWDNFTPRGIAQNVTVKVLRDPKEHPEIHTSVVATLDGRASIRAGEISVHIEDLVGTVNVENDALEYKIKQGRYRQASVTGWGKVPGAEQETPEKHEIEIERAPLDEALRKALPPDAKSIWALINPEGKINATLRIDRAAKATAYKTNLILRAEGEASFAYTGFPLRVAGVRGEIRVRDHFISFERLEGVCYGSRVSLSDGRFSSDRDLSDTAQVHVSIQGLKLTDPVYLAMPKDVREALRDVGFQGTVSADLKIDSLTVGMSSGTSLHGTLQIEKASLGRHGEITELDGTLHIAEKSSFDNGGRFAFRGRFDGKRLMALDQWHMNALQCTFDVSNDELTFDNVTAGFCGGTISDSYARFKFNATNDFEGALKLKAAELNQLKRGNKLAENLKPIHGKIDGWVNFAGQGSDTKKLTGDGGVRVTEAEIWEIPIVFNVLNFLALKIPEKEFIEEAKVKFKIASEKFSFKELTLNSDSVSFSGKGHVDFEGNLNVRLELDILPGMPFFIEPLGDLMGGVGQWIQGALIPVSVTGTLDDPQAHIEPLGIGGG